MHKSIFFGLALILAIGIHVEGASVAGAKTKTDPVDAWTECSRAWHRCWDKCRTRACYRRCNDLYDICVKIEIPGVKLR